VVKKKKNLWGTTPDGSKVSKSEQGCCVSIAEMVFSLTFRAGGGNQFQYLKDIALGLRVCGVSLQ